MWITLPALDDRFDVPWDKIAYVVLTSQIGAEDVAVSKNIIKGNVGAFEGIFLSFRLKAAVTVAATDVFVIKSL